MTFKALDANQVVFDELVLDKTTGTSDLRNPNSWIYPNPASNVFYIHNPTSDKFSYRVRSINGQLLMQQNQIYGERATVHMSQSGIYIVEIICSDKVYTQKIIIK